MNYPGQGGPGSYEPTQVGFPIGGQQPGGDPNQWTSGPQPAFGHPGGQPGSGGWGAVPPPAPPAKNNNKLILGIFGGAIAIVLVVAVVLVVMAFTGGSSRSPEETVTAYLEALAAGDAGAVKELIKAPPSDTLLTDEILKQQQEIAPITGITVREGSGALSQVNATYKFGDRNADVDIAMTKSGGEWKVDNGALEINLDSLNVPDATLFGVDISKDSKVYVFPGPLLWGSQNKYLTAGNEDPDDFPLGPDTLSYISTSGVKAGLSSEGKSAVETAIDTYLTDCATSVEPDAGDDKPGCEQSIFYGAKEGTVRWTKPTDLSDLEYRLDYSDPTKVSISGSVDWGATFVPTYGSRNSATVSEYMGGTVDLTESTPSYTAR